MAKKAQQFPVVLVTGPRQAGKTTLCRSLFPGHRYVTLESPDTRRDVRNDPRGFLREVAAGAVIDEVQNVPELLSYLQAEVDERPTAGRFVLTGSQHFAIAANVSQSLAGRVGLAELMPLSVSELAQAGSLGDVWTTVWKGGYPALFDRHLSPDDWFSGYVATYVERDVRQLLNVSNLVAFETFLSLAAARTASLLDHSQIASDVGVSQPTARQWFTALEASYVAFRVPPFFRNVGKRLVKTPKLHFVDSGLLCYLLRIRSPEQLRLHPLRGAIFESWVVSEQAKAYRKTGERSDLTFFRDRHGLEVDLVCDFGLQRTALEVKSSETVASDGYKSLLAFADLCGRADDSVKTDSCLVYTGNETRKQGSVTIVPWKSVGDFPWAGLADPAAS